MTLLKIVFLTRKAVARHEPAQDLIATRPSTEPVPAPGVTGKRRCRAWPAVLSASLIRVICESLSQRTANREKSGAIPESGCPGLRGAILRGSPPELLMGQQSWFRGQVGSLFSATGQTPGGHGAERCCGWAFGEAGRDANPQRCCPPHSRTGPGPSPGKPTAATAKDSSQGKRYQSVKISCPAISRSGGEPPGASFQQSRCSLARDVQESMNAISRRNRQTLTVPTATPLVQWVKCETV
jgi:hypothetical protein